MISRRMLWAARHLMKAMLVGVLAAVAIPLVHAQSQDADCLAAGAVSALAQERGGQTWVYASADKTFFDQPFPVSLLEVVVPGAGPVGVRAGVTAVRPQTGLRPPEEVTLSFAPDTPLHVFVHVMMGRPLERDATVVHRIRALRGGAQVYQFASTPEDWKAGWTEYWLQHPLPPGRLTPGTYTIEWQFGTTVAASIPLTIRSR